MYSYTFVCDVTFGDCEDLASAVTCESRFFGTLPLSGFAAWRIIFVIRQTDERRPASESILKR